MKRIFYTLFFALLLYTIIGGSAFGQGWTKFGTEKYFYQTELSETLDSAETIYSSAFTLDNYDGFSWWDYPWTSALSATVPTTGTPKLVAYFQGSFIKTSGFANLDTLASTDSTLSATEYRSKIDFNNAKYPYYRWAYTGQATNPDSVTVTHKMFNPKTNFIKLE